MPDLLIVAAWCDPMDTGCPSSPAFPAAAQPDWNDSAVQQHFTRLARVAEATKSAVVITDCAGITVWINEGFTQITGYELQEAVGRTPGQLLQGPETDRRETARIGAALLARQRVSAELVNYAKDGRRYWVGLKIEPLFTADGELDGFMAIEADITVRQEEKQALEQMTRRFNMATRAGRVGVWKRDAHGNIVWWNEAMWDIFGRDPGTFELSFESWLGLIHPDDRERMRKEAADLGTSPNAFDWHYRIVLPDGEVRHVQSTGTASEAGDAAERFAGITLDVTERVQADEREQALQRELRSISHQAGMAEIATGVLHNVGNVLNSLGIANSTARRELKGLRLKALDQATGLLQSNRDNLAVFLTVDERGRYLPDYLTALSAQLAVNVREIQAEIDTTEGLLRHLSDIVNAQQALARIGGRYEPISLRDLVETARLVLSPESGQIDITCEYGEMPYVMSDRHKVLQIIINLLQNARDAVQLNSTGPRRICVNLARDGDDLLLVVEDSGIGMSKEVLSQLWQFGFTTKQNGHGFGLHNCANAAHDIGGTLVAHSEGVGRGSRFTLRLPINHTESMLPGVAA